MYSLDEINEALENGKLSDALYKIQRYAQEHELTQLAKWCSWELNGYPNGYEEIDQSEETKIMKYRTIPVEWRDIYGRPMIIDPKLAFIQKVPIWIGVAEIEGVPGGRIWLFYS